MFHVWLVIGAANNHLYPASVELLIERIIMIHLKLDKFILFRLRREANRICVVMQAVMLPYPIP